MERTPQRHAGAGTTTNPPYEALMGVVGCKYAQSTDGDFWVTETDGSTRMCANDEIPIAYTALKQARMRHREGAGPRGFGQFSYPQPSGQSSDAGEPISSGARKSKKCATCKGSGTEKGACKMARCRGGWVYDDESPYKCMACRGEMWYYVECSTCDGKGKVGGCLWG